MDVRRSRTVAAPLDDVWQIVRDPYHLPRWWPRTQRVEGVSSGGWTSVLVTDKGRSVRADYRVDLTKSRERRRWSQEVAGTPFEKLFREVVYEIALFQGDAEEPAAVGRFVHVYVSGPDRAVTPIPDVIRTVLEPLAIDPA